MSFQPPPNEQIAWHAQSGKTALEKLQSGVSGLTNEQAQQRFAVYGSNQLPVAKKPNVLWRFLLQFHNILIYVLIGAAVITVFLNHYMDTVIILAVVLVNALIGFIQEGKAEKALDAIRHMLAPNASVVRNGERVRLPAQKLVPGDIVLLESGDKVPADIRLLSAHGLTIQEAVLTGESVPVEKQVSPVSEQVMLGDRSCMAYSGTLVSSGQGKGVVVATGKKTEIGQISGMLLKVETLETPLVTQMASFAKWLTFLILLVCGLLLVYGTFVQNLDFNDMFMIVVGLSVAAIPEGLPAVLTITLALGVQSMAKRHAIIRRLPAIETLGSISVICSDKTGTLTRNEMMVSCALTYQNFYTITGDGYSPVGSIKCQGNEGKKHDKSILKELSLCATLCNDSSLKNQDDEWQVEGDPMEGALLVFAKKTGSDIQQDLLAWTRTDLIAFDASYRFMATLNHNHQGQGLIFVKGAPEQILNMCCNQRTLDHQVEALDKQHWLEEVDRVASMGQRVIAMAVKEVKPDHTELEHVDVKDSLTLVGMVGLIDPPRPEAIHAIEECYSAGIQVKMITGDHLRTASAIAKQLHLRHPDKAVTGAELDQMSDAQLKETVLECEVFARTSPEHKLRLVMALQSHGLVVAMTGDGVNDAPALKRADAGVAMGRKGSEVAKESAELVLTDDNFASIVAAVREGRTVYDNIKKVISWTLPTNAGEAATIIVALMFGLSLPVTPIQILWINLITASTLGIALAFEPTEAKTMQRAPRGRHEPLIGSELVWHILLVALLFLVGVFGIFSYALERGYSIELARTMALNTLVVMEIFHLFFIRNIYGTSLTLKAVRGTKVVWAVVVIITLAQFTITYWPPLQAVFMTKSIALLDGFLIVTIGVLLFAIIEIEKQIRLRLKNWRKGEWRRNHSMT